MSSLRYRLAGGRRRHSRNLLRGSCERFVCVQISTVNARLASDSEDLLDDYRFWRERDRELKSLAVSDPEDPDN